MQQRQWRLQRHVRRRRQLGMRLVCRPTSPFRRLYSIWPCRVSFIGWLPASRDPEGPPAACNAARCKALASAAASTGGACRRWGSSAPAALIALHIACYAPLLHSHSRCRAAASVVDAGSPSGPATGFGGSRGAARMQACLSGFAGTALNARCALAVADPYRGALAGPGPAPRPTPRSHCPGMGQCRLRAAKRRGAGAQVVAGREAVPLPGLGQVCPACRV